MTYCLVEKSRSGKIAEYLENLFYEMEVKAGGEKFERDMLTHLVARFEALSRE